MAIRKISLTYPALLYVLIWGGMFSGANYLEAKYFYANIFYMITGLRGLLPLAAAYLCLIWVFITKSRLPMLDNPLGFLFFYLLTGLVSSIFLSPKPFVALFWAGSYVAPILAIWMAVERPNPLEELTTVIYWSYAFVIGILLIILPEALRIGMGRAQFTQFYRLPFGMGTVQSNGVGRFALIAVIISFVRVVYQQGKLRFLGMRLRYLWLVLLAPALFVLAQTRSRTSLLGLAVTALLFAYLRGINWRFFMTSPVVFYIVYKAGYQGRAGGHLARLIGLTGREATWRSGIALTGQSPFVGWGFHADRLLLHSEHMHNSYLHALLQGGIIGALFFVGALVSVWFLILRNGLIKKIRHVQGRIPPELAESILLIGFLTSRSFFESTAAFYGVDLLVIVPAITYIYLWIRGGATDEKRAAEMSIPVRSLA